MQVKSIFVLAILCSAAFAAAPSTVDTCMYDKVSRMTEEGQKLAFFLTRTAIVTSYSTHTETSYSTETRTQYISSFVNSEEWVSTHGGWSNVCNRIAQKCHNKRGKTVCRKWKRSCKSHNAGFKWTVKKHIVVNNIPKLSGGMTIVNGSGKKTGVKIVKVGGHKIVKVGGKKTRRCVAFAPTPRKRVCIRRNKSRKCVKFATFHRINRCLSWKRVVKTYTARAGFRFNKRAYLRVIRQKRLTIKNKVQYRKWRRNYRRQVKVYIRRHKNIRIRKGFFKLEKKFRVCRKKMAQLAHTRKWIVKMDALNIKRRQRLALRLKKYRAIKDVRVRKLKLRKFKIYRRKSRLAFKRKVSLKLAKGCGCKTTYVKFNKSRKSVRRIHVRASRGRRLRRRRGGKRIFRGRRRGLKVRYSIRRPIRKVTIKVSRPEIKRCFVYRKRGPARKVVRKICAKRFRKWSIKAKSFRCISRGHKYVIRRCKAKKITKKGKVVCARRVKVYGVRFCKKRAFRNRRVRCIKRAVSYPKARCVKSTKRGAKRFCLRFKFHRPAVFCARYKKFFGKRRCIRRKTFAGIRYFKIRCAKTGKIIKVRKGKKCGCKKYKVSIRRKFRLRVKSLKFKCLKCAAWTRAHQRRIRFNRRVSLKLRVRGGRRGKRSLRFRLRGKRSFRLRGKRSFRLRVRAPRRACVRVSRVVRKPSVSVRRSACRRGRRLQKVTKNVAKRLAQVKAWYRNQKIHQRNYVKGHMWYNKSSTEIYKEDAAHWRILFSRKRLSKASLLNNLRRHKIALKNLRAHYLKHETWRWNHVKEEHALRLRWARYEITDAAFTAAYRKLWIKRHNFLFKYYRSHHA